jgi:transposase-like protein
MTESLWAVAPLLQARFQQQLRGEMRGFAQAWLNQLMKVEQVLALGCSPYERVPQRRGHRNGYQRRFLESRWGSLRLAVPRTRNTPTPFRSVLLERYRRRQRELEELICDLVAGGLSHRRVARLARECLGVPLSAQSVSAILSALDAEVARFHRRSLGGRYRTVYLDGKHAKACAAAGRGRRGRGRMQPRVLLLAWGVTHQGEEELIDYRVVPSESQEHWQAFLSDLETRGLRREAAEKQTLELLVTDDDGGLEAARLTVFPGVPHQPCLFHKLQAIAGHLTGRSHRQAIMGEAAAIYRELRTVPQALARLERWRRRWLPLEPEAVRCFAADFEGTLVYLALPQSEWSRVRTTNPLERLIKELNRKISQVGVFPSDRSWDRMTYLTWHYLQSGGYPNSSQYHFTHNS